VEINPQDLAMQIGKLIGDRCALEMANVERNLAKKTDEFRIELMAEVREVKTEIRDIKKSQAEHSVAIGRIETRMEEGEKRFQALERRVSELEKRETETSLTLAKLTGVGGVGAILGGGIALFFKG